MDKMKGQENGQPSVKPARVPAAPKPYMPPRLTAGPRLAAVAADTKVSIQ